MKRSAILSAIVALTICTVAYSQVPAAGSYHDYYNFLALSGLAVSPSLMYHSHSAGSWELATDHLWSGSLGSQRSFEIGSVQLMLFPLQLRVSASTTYAKPELNDGSWWQGRGLNSFFRTGFRFAGPHVSLTFLPEFWTAQNLPYELLPTSASDSDGFGYLVWGNTIDYPQRMGNEPLCQFDWGQSEIRLNWRQLTAGFGTENILAGPSRTNSLMFSGNGPGFPHVDVGLRKTHTPIGYVELRGFRGRLQESDYYDVDPENNYTFIHGIVFGYAPSYIPGFNLGVKWHLNANWTDWETNRQLQILGFDFSESHFGSDPYDQRGSITLEYVMPASNFRWYFEYFREDYSPRIYYIILVPGHAAGYTVGGEKQFLFASGTGINVAFEWNELIQSRDYVIGLGTGGTYYTHHIVRHGFTHKGQLLGAGTGPGSDVQTLIIDYYDRWGKAGLMVQRVGWNKDYLYRDPSRAGDPEGPDYFRLKTDMNLGINVVLLTRRHLLLEGEIVYSYRLSENYIKDNDISNLYVNVAVNYNY